MARYTYNSSLVEQTIDELSQACSAITNTNSEIQKGISAITSARGGELFADVGFGTITGYESAVTEMVDSMSTLIRQKAQEIEEYESAPWYKKLWNSLAMGALKVVEGIASVGENLMDGVVSLAGFVGGVFNSDFQDSVAEFIKKDHVGEAFYNAYETGWLQDVNKYSVYSHTSTAANVLKGIGSATAYVAISLIPGVGVGASAAVAGVGGLGSGTQSGLQAGKTFNQAFAQGVKEGVVAAGTTLVLGKVGEKLANTVRTTDASGKTVLTMFDDVVGATDDAANSLKGIDKVTNSLKNTANTLVNTKIGNVLVSGAEKLASVGAGGIYANSSQYQVINGVATGIGTVAGGMPQDAVASTSYIDAINTPESIGVEYQGNFIEENAQLTQDVKQVVENVESGNYEYSVESTDNGVSNPTIEQNNGKGTPQNNGRGSYPNNSSSAVQPKVEVEEISPPTVEPGTTTPSSPSSPSTPSTPSTNTPTDPGTSYTDPISNGSGTLPGGTPSSGGGGGGESTTPNISTGGTETGGYSDITGSDYVADSNLVSSDVLDSLGSSSGSLSSVASGSVNIPTSSTPILSSSGTTTKSASVIPMAAGLGAAGLAGLGTKAYLDKKEKSNEEEEEEAITTEEWQEDADSMNIDYGETTTEEDSDYLMPTDEFAFQEN